MERRAESLLDQEVASFQLTRKLGSGGMAVVYQAESTLDSTIVRAIKVIRDELAERPEFVKRFAEEARVLERLQHPNIVRFFGIRKDRELMVMELELLEGQSLDKRLQAHGPASAAQLANWMIQATEGVAFAHASGYIHRDLKPDNLFLTQTGTIKVLDFGLARALDDADRASNITTMGERVPGSPAYMAPEIWTGSTPTAASDVYALGITLYELALGHHPFESDGVRRTQHQMMHAQLNERLPRLDEVRNDLPRDLIRIAAWATHKDPSKRPENARQFLQALQGAVGSLARQVEAHTEPSKTNVNWGEFDAGTKSGPVTIPTEVDGESKPGLPWVPIALGVFGVCVIGVIAMNMNQKQPGKTEDPARAVVEPPTPDIPDPETETGTTGESEPPPHLENPWVLVQPSRNTGRTPTYLGLSQRSASKDQESGFRRSRKIEAPTGPYEIQQHEVTVGEYVFWAEQQALDVPIPSWRVDVPIEDARDFPMTAVVWEDALAYCTALGGGLPTEEQWEYAARGAEQRPYAWGAQPLDIARTHVYEGLEAVPIEVRSSNQDHTPGTADTVIYDLMGNVQEYTADVYRDSFVATADRTHLRAGPSSIRALRGLPLRAELPDTPPAEGAAWRERVCVTDVCQKVPVIMAKRELVGWRCVRAAVKER